MLRLLTRCPPAAEPGPRTRPTPAASPRQQSACGAPARSATLRGKPLSLPLRPGPAPQRRSPARAAGVDQANTLSLGIDGQDGRGTGSDLREQPDRDTAEVPTATSARSRFTARSGTHRARPPEGPGCPPVRRPRVARATRWRGLRESLHGSYTKRPIASWVYPAAPQPRDHGAGRGPPTGHGTRGDHEAARTTGVPRCRGRHPDQPRHPGPSPDLTTACTDGRTWARARRTTSRSLVIATTTAFPVDGPIGRSCVRTRPQVSG